MTTWEPKIYNLNSVEKQKNILINASTWSCEDRLPNSVYWNGFGDRWNSPWANFTWLFYVLFDRKNIAVGLVQVSVRLQKCRPNLTQSLFQPHKGWTMSIVTHKQEVTHRGDNIEKVKPFQWFLPYPVIAKYLDK